MRQCEIVVWDYCDARHGGNPSQGMDTDPVKFEVNAWCLQGETGFRAFFIIDETLYEAHGDDGHWWLVGRMNVYWLEEYKQTLDAVEIPPSALYSMRRKAVERCEKIIGEEIDGDEGSEQDDSDEVDVE